MDESAKEKGAIPNPEQLAYYAQGVEFHRNYSVIRELNKISMLSPEVLLILSYLGKVVEGRILEIGPYIGGSTIALAMGNRLHDSGKILSIESGGEYESHPHVPSSDIICDFRKNVQTFGLQDQVCLIEGWSNEQKTIDAVVQKLAGETIGLIFIDADGGGERDLTSFANHLGDNCILVIDDYLSSSAPEKQTKIKTFVDKCVEADCLRPIGIFPWGTWVGVMSNNIWI